MRLFYAASSGLLAIYALARVLQVFPGEVPMLAVVALHVVPLALFALIHGFFLYGWRGILAFSGICLAVGNLSENVGVRTGFPFGHYYFTDVMGPKVLDVPVMLGLAYVGMAYLSWTLGRILLGRFRVVALPMVAGFMMVAWDFSMDPVWSTVIRAWIWLDGGPYFGVPVSNFVGWYLTVYVFYQLFALYLRGRPTRVNPLPLGYWRWAVVFYATSAAGNLLLLIPKPATPVVADPSGAIWRVSDIAGASALVSLFVMGAFVFAAWARIPEQNS